MELNELQNPCFSKWVDKEEKIHGNNSKNFSEDDVEIAIEQWATHPQNLNSKLKVKVRHGMHPKFRARLWSVASGGVKKHHTNPQYYHEVVSDLGIQIPSQLPNSMFNNKQSESVLYLLSPDGVKEYLNILYVLSQVHPDIHFCPLLPPLTALCLHFMDKEEVFCCVSALLDSNQSFLDQSQTAVTLTAKTFQDCLKIFMKKSYKQLKSLIALSRHIEVNKGTVFFPLWISWIFCYLDFWTLIYIADNFLIQGPKILIRVGLILFSQFEKWIVRKQVMLESDEDVEVKFRQFVAESPLKGYKLLEAAFKIRGLSRKKLASIKAQNMVLLKEGILEVPFSLDNKVEVPTLYKVEGTDIITDQQWEILSSWLPEKVQIKHPFCLFSTQNDGFSIQTLYKQCENEAESMLLVKTSKGEILGAFCTSPWSERRDVPRILSYFGTGETFVFSLNPQSKMYSWRSSEDGGKGNSDFFMAGDNTCLMVGGGGDNALWVDGELLHGHSGTSTTFNNEPLTSEKDFEIVRVEVLGFKS